MRILLQTQVVPYPPDSGPKIKTYNVLRYLAERHDVHLVSFVRTPAEEANAQALRRFCAGVATVPLRRSRARDAGYLLRSFVTGRPFLIERDASTAMRDTVWGMICRHDFDAVHADQLSMAQFAVDLPVPTRVLDEHNAVWTIVRRSARNEGPGPRRLLMELEWRRLRGYEGKVCRDFDLVTVVSTQDYLALAEAAQSIFPTKVIPIAVDCDEMAFTPRTAEARELLSLATMFYPPNVEGVRWFATEVFPIVRGRLRDARLNIVGSRPPEEITRLQRPDSGIAVTGYVPDLDPVLRKCGVMVVPVRSGSGMRVKILEAFARGIPVVSTSVGVEGIDARPGEHLLVADTPEEFAEAVTLLLTEPARAALLAQRAREAVESRYDWRTALRGLDEVYPSGDEQAGGGTVESASASAGAAAST